MCSPSSRRQFEKPLNTVSHFPAALTACSRYAVKKKDVEEDDGGEKEKWG